MTEYVTPNIHTVLKKYQTSAQKSLQGPGHTFASGSSLPTAPPAGSVVSGVVGPSSSSQAVPLSGGRVLGSSSIIAGGNGIAAVSLNGCGSVHLGGGGGGGGILEMQHQNPASVRKSPPCDLSKPLISCSLNLHQHQSHQQLASPPMPALPLIKKEILSSPEPAAYIVSSPSNMMEGSTLVATAAAAAAAAVVAVTASSVPLPPISSSIKIIPPPPPEVSQPILSTADLGSGELYETRLEGKKIGCFSLGGEMRLCLPQFLNNVLADFSLEQINRSFDELGIFCSQCTPDQLLEFKAAKILPPDVKSSGLITRTDAERLCAVLLHRSDRNSYINVEDIPKGAISFKVFHRCFGKCDGICTPDMYSYSKPTCIMCLECKGWFSPQKFVGHVHRKVENRTCHWGFDSRNWHDYLHVALDVENREKYQKILDELKEVEVKEQQKAQQEINYVKRKVSNVSLNIYLIINYCLNNCNIEVSIFRLCLILSLRCFH